MKGLYDFGPMGVELKMNLKNSWWKSIVYERDDIEGLDSTILTSPTVLKYSGHEDTFSDPLVDCKKCKSRWRADQLENNQCPSCASNDLTEPRPFNLMFKTAIGPVDDGSSFAYLRPETAQQIFVNFKNIIDSTSRTPPFGIAQIGKSFRNEIDEVPSQLGSCCLRRHLFCLEHLGIVSDASCEAFALQQIEQSSLTTDVVIREIELGNAHVIEREIMLLHVALEQSLLDHPVDFGLHTAEVLRLDGLEGALPQVHDAIDHGVGSQVPAINVLRHLLEVLRLHLQGGHLATVVQGDGARTRCVVADFSDGPNRVLERQISHHGARLEHAQHEVGSSDLQHRRGLAHIAIADDDVKPSIQVSIRVRLIAGIDDGS